MKKILIISLLMILGLFLAQQAADAFALNISPPSYQTTALPGSSVTGKITIQNTADKATGIMLYTQDWLYKEDGSKAFYAAGTTPLSCAKWIRIFPQKFQVEENSAMTAQFTINVPEDAHGGYYAVIFSESVPVGGTDAEEGMMIKFAGRLGTIVYLDVEGTVDRKAEVETLTVSAPQSNDPLKMELSLKNTGNVYVVAHGTLNIIDEDGTVFGKESFGPMNTLPGDTRPVTAEWLGELEEGEYDVVVTLDIGADEPIVEERKISVVTGGEIASLSTDTASANPVFTAIVKNTGHLNLDASGTIDVLDTAGSVVKTVKLKRALIAPGKERGMAGTLEDGLSAGAYTARARISIGDKELTKEEGFSIK